jgi:hypothetical protein
MTLRFTSIIIFVLYFSVSANNFIKPFGINIGIGQSNEGFGNGNYGENPYTYNSKFSFSTLISYETLRAKYFSLIPMIGYSKKGADKTTNVIGRNIIMHLSENRNSDYLEFDLFFKPKYNFQSFTPFILIGPRFDYLLNRNIKTNYYYEIDSNIQNYNITDISTKFIYGLSLGMGISFHFVNVNISPFTKIDWDLMSSSSNGYFLVDNIPVPYRETYKNVKYALYLAINML